MDDKKVNYSTEKINARGDVWGRSEEKTGRFVGFTPDYQHVIIEEQNGSIVRVYYKFVRFMR